MLLSNGSDVNSMNYDFEFPIHFAAHAGNQKLLKNETISEKYFHTLSQGTRTL